MKRIICFTLMTLAVALPHVADAQDAGYFQQSVGYTIRAKLDTKKHMLTGSESITYQNNSPDTLRHFFLHLYPNAYESKNTPFMKDLRRSFNLTLMNVPKKYRSYLNISDVTIDGVSVTPVVDYTIARINLAKPLLPGASMTLSLQFESKIRYHIGRAGYHGGQYDMAQWYPKVVVYDKKGFHPDPFQTGEFYGEYAKFDVYLEVPENYVVAATGVPTDGDPGWSLNVPGNRTKRNKTDATKTILFEADRVHDFAWNASPNFAVEDTTWNDVSIMTFFDKGNRAWRDSTLTHGLRAVEWLSERVGMYPYPRISIVQGLLRGGMEYPMLVMDGRVSEPLVVHELAHEYFYGILGNDERAEAWLDEGLASFQTDLYMMTRYGPYGNKRLWNWYEKITPQYTLLGKNRRQVFTLERLGYGERVSTRSEMFINSYRINVYRKATLILFALRYVVGDETFDRIMHEYFDKWQFKHVNEQRLEAVASEVSGQDLGWFFEEWLHTRKVCDYRLGEVKSVRRPGGDGYDVKVRIDRLGEIIMPLELELTFDDGTIHKTRVDGRLRTIVQTFEFPRKVKKAALNPNNEIIDNNMTDNYIPKRRDLQIDWPNNNYYPEGAYQIRHRPSVWYNDIDGVRVGYKISSSFFDFYRRFQLGLYYGIDSKVVDFSTSYTIPTKTLGLNGNLELSGYKLEGRRDFTFKLSMRRRVTLIRPPTQQLTYEFNYHDLFDSAYVAQPQFYEEGADIAPVVFTYKTNPQLDILQTKAEAGLRLGRRWFGSNWKYNRFYTSLDMQTRRLLVPFDFGARVFFGIISGDLPTQQKFNIAGAGVLGQETEFFLASPGAVPPDLHYLMPGDGNLRGYAEGTFPVNRLLAASFKLGKEVPLISQPKNRWLGEVKLSAFADVGRILDSSNPLPGDPRVQTLVDNGILDQALVDAGVGLRVRRNFPFWDLYLRYDIPLYVNQPAVNGETDETQYRYLFSLTSVFSFSMN